jgi:hypothetical protein
VVSLIALLVLGGCGALVTVAGVRLMGSMTAPVDVANEFLDAARSGDDVAPYLCGDASPGDVPPELANSEGQRLTEVHVSNNRVADVGGRLTLSGGDRTPIQMELRRAGDDWCVWGVRY